MKKTLSILCLILLAASVAALAVCLSGKEDSREFAYGILGGCAVYLAFLLIRFLLGLRADISRCVLDIFAIVYVCMSDPTFFLPGLLIAVTAVLDFVLTVYDEIHLHSDTPKR